MIRDRLAGGGAVIGLSRFFNQRRTRKVAMETGRFEGKVALVTGGTQGVGAATARMMAARGAAGLIICGRQTLAGEAIAKDLTNSGCPTLFVTADLANVVDCFAVVDAAESRFGALHVLANVAGFTARGTILDTSVDLFDRLIAINTRAPFFLMQKAIPLMEKSGGGAIVNVLSIAAHGGAPHISAYVASKSALIGLTKNVAQSATRSRIRVNGLNMGWTATPGEDLVQQGAQGLGPDWLEAVARDRPFGRLLTPEEIARAIVFLASDESAIITGSVLDFEQAPIGPAN
jgi:NAD(P)-dependent dehydrogenase (short-subunit alcohol dehydrogenase family)